MPHEVFLASRIRECWLASGQAPADDDNSVALGLAGAARVITAAALIMSISFAALGAAQVSFLRMLGLGLTMAVLADASLVRTLLVPAFMSYDGPIQLVGTEIAGAPCMNGSESARSAMRKLDLVWSEG